MKKCNTLRELLGGKIPSPQKVDRFPTGEKTNACHQYCGQPGCNYMTEQTKRVIEGLAAKMFLDFPDRFDRRLAVCDASISGLRTAPGHDAHAGGWRVDFNYFCHGWPNWTEHVPAWGDRRMDTRKGRAGYMVGVTHIWDLPHFARGLRADVFDWERNFVFFARVLDVFPWGKVLVSDGIYDYLYSRAAAEYRDDWKRCGRRIIATGPTLWNHHTHAHIDFGTCDRPDGFDVNWDLARDWIPCK